MSALTTIRRPWRDVPPKRGTLTILLCLAIGLPIFRLLDPDPSFLWVLFQGWLLAMVSLVLDLVLPLERWVETRAQWVLFCILLLAIAVLISGFTTTGEQRATVFDADRKVCTTTEHAAGNC